MVTFNIINISVYYYSKMRKKKYITGFCSLMFMLVLNVVVYATNTTNTTADIARSLDTATYNFLYLTILVFIYVLSFISKQQIIGVLGSIGLLIYSISFFSYNTGLAVIILASSLILMMYFTFIEW